MDPRTRFTLLQQAVRDANRTAQTLRVALECRYQQLCYAPLTKRRQVEALNRTADRHQAKFFAFLESISPRNWAEGVPIRWIVDSLTFEDATTRGQLTDVPPPAWGYEPQDSQRFALPVREERHAS